MTDFAIFYIRYLIALDWSPEQISGALKQRGWLDVPSHEWIYQYIYQDKSKGGELHQHLRHQKTYRKRGYKTQTVEANWLIEQAFTVATRS